MIWKSQKYKKKKHWAAQLQWIHGIGLLLLLLKHTCCSSINVLTHKCDIATEAKKPFQYFIYDFHRENEESKKSMHVSQSSMFSKPSKGLLTDYDVHTHTHTQYQYKLWQHTILFVSIEQLYIEVTEPDADAHCSLICQNHLIRATRTWARLTKTTEKLVAHAKYRSLDK